MPDRMTAEEARQVARRVVAELERDAVPIVPEDQTWALVAGLVLGGEIEEMESDGS